MYGTGNFPNLREVPHIADQEEFATFVVCGDLQTIDADLYLLPTDSFGTVTSAWDWLIGERKDKLRSSADKLADGLPVFVRTESSRLALAVNVGGAQASNSVVELRDRLEKSLSLLDQVLTRRQEEGRSVTSPGRAKALLAMPVIGVNGGGLGGETGQVLTMLLEVLGAIKNDRNPIQRNFDVVIVCNSQNDYGAIQSIRRRFRNFEGDEVNVLCRHAWAGDLSIMFGAGASIPLGLPSWLELLEAIGRELHLPNDQVEALSRLDPGDAATILSEVAGSQTTFEDLVRRQLQTSRCSLTHALVATIGPRLAITTNYDKGYELAVEAIDGARPRVLPWDRNPGSSQPLLLKLHGDVDRGQIVLSRDDFATAHVARRPLIGMVQDHLLTGHLLTVGSSVSDPTLVQAAEEVGALISRMSDSKDKPVGTAVLTEDDVPRQILLSRHFTVMQAASESLESATDKHDVRSSARRVDLLLDLVALFTAPDLSYVLDPRYAGMLTERDQRIVEGLRELESRVSTMQRSSRSHDLQAFVESFLQSLGATISTREIVNSRDASRVRRDLLIASRIWEKAPAVADFGRERWPILAIEELLPRGADVTVQVRFLNRAPVVRTVTEIVIDPDSVWIMAKEGSIRVSEPRDDDFGFCSDLDIPVPPGAVLPLIGLMKAVVVEWEEDREDPVRNPVFWEVEDGIDDPLEVVVVYGSDDLRTIQRIEYVISPNEPIFRAYWKDGKWIETAPDYEPLCDSPSTRIHTRSIGRFFKMVRRNESRLAYPLAVLASSDPQAGIVKGDLQPEILAWIEENERGQGEALSRGGGSASGLSILELFLEGGAEIQVSDLLDWVL